MPEGENTVSDTDKTGSLSRFKVVESQSYSRNGVEHHTEFAGSSAAATSSASRVPRQPVHLGTERVEYPARSGGQPRPDGGRSADGGITRARRGGQFDEGQRVSTGFFDQPVTQIRRQIGGPLGKQGCGGRLAEPAQTHHAKPAQIGHAVTVAHREQQHHAFRAQPPTREQQRIPRRPVQPLGIVDQA